MASRTTHHHLAARGASSPAFDRRGVPYDYVAPPSHTLSILGRRALSSGRFAGLGATRNVHHGLLALGHAEESVPIRCAEGFGGAVPGGRNSPHDLLEPFEATKWCHPWHCLHLGADEPAFHNLFEQ